MEIWEEQALKEIQKENEERLKKDNGVLNSVKQIVTKDFMKKINTEIKEMDNNYSFRIKDEPQGNKQEDPDINKYVDQYTCGCGLGDCFHGSVYIQLPNKKWLVWNYTT